MFVLERRHIQGRSASAIATDLVQSYQHFCGDSDAAAPQAAEQPRESGTDLPETFRSIL